MSIQTYLRRGPTSIVVNPCRLSLTTDGINLNTLDIDVLSSFVKSYKVGGNQIATKVSLVEDNMFYYTSLVDLVNRYVFYPLWARGICQTIKASALTTFASLNKQINGSPHDHHSYLLENDAKSVGVKLFVPPDNTRVKSVVEDMAK